MKKYVVKIGDTCRVVCTTLRLFTNEMVYLNGQEALVISN